MINVIYGRMIKKVKKVGVMIMIKSKKKVINVDY